MSPRMIGSGVTLPLTRNHRTSTAARKFKDAALCSAIAFCAFMHAAQAQTCELYPIALSAKALSNAAPGTVLNGLNGMRPGNFGWLSWSGKSSEQALVASLNPPGNCSTYVNPHSASDRQVSVGDWVWGKAGVANSKQVRNALELLKTTDISIPVWDQASGSGDRAAYRVSGFARVRIVDYHLPQRNRLTVRFLGFTDCDQQNLAPTVDAGVDQVITLPASASLEGTVTDDGLPASGTLSIAWSKVSGPGSVTFSAKAARATANFSAPGDYVLRLTADDGQASANDEVAIRANSAPVAQNLAINTDEDTAAAVVLQATDTEGDALTYQVAALPQHGTLGGVSPNLTYLPAANFNGTDEFTFRVNDGLADSEVATVRIVVRPVNDGPAAVAQSVETDEDTPFGIALRGTDLDGDTLTFTIATPPAHGTLNGTSPLVTYVPAPDYFGLDEFTFTANDGTTSSAPATISIRVVAVNDAPVGLGGAVTTEEDIPVSLTLEGTDVDGSELAFVIVTPPAHGSLGGDPPNLIYTPGTNFAGTDDFDFQVSDGELDSTQVKFSINVNPVNDAPHLIVPGPLTVREDTLLHFAGGGVFSVTDVDAAGEMVELTLTVTNGTLWLETSNGLVFANGSNGSSGMVVHGSLDSLNTALFGLMYLGSSNYSGLDTLAVHVNDGGRTGLGGSLGDSNCITIQVSPVNDAPIFVSTPVTIAEAIPFPSKPATSRPYTHSYAYDVDAIDPESGVVSYSLREAPAGMSINATSGLIKWLPNTNDIGSVTITVAATDAQGAEGFQTFNIVVPPMVINIPPVVNAGPDRSFADISLPITLKGVVSDDGVPANQPLTIEWVVLAGPGNVAFSSPTSAVTAVNFDAPGIYVLQLNAHDTMEGSSDVVEVRAGLLCSVKPSSEVAAWWPANLTTTELVGGRDATLSETTGFGPGLVGSAFAFDSPNDFVQASAHTNLDLATGGSGFTVEFWIKPHSLAVGGVLGWAGGVRAERLSSGSLLRFHVASSGTTFSQASLWPNVASLTWTHVALTYDRMSSQARIYANGVLVASTTVGTNLLTTASDFYLGRVPGSTGTFLGSLDEVTLYRRPLNAQEVYEVFASGSAGKCPIDHNAAPLVYAGTDLFVTGAPGTVTLHGEVEDDGLPTEGALRTHWSLFDGPGTVDFASSTSLVTSATFGTNGIYLLQLTADDGQVQRRDLVEVRVETLCTIAQPQGLAAWWPANGSAEDVVNGYEAVMGNGASFTSGKVASAFRLDGNDYILVPAQTNYDVGTSPSGFTLEFWIKPDSLTVGGVLGWAGGVRAERLSSGSLLRFHVASSGTTFLQASLWPNVASLTWTHVALTYDRASGQARFYANGVLVAAATVGTNLLTTANDFYLGQAPGSVGFFPGLLDEVTLYRRPLNAQEIHEVFASGGVGKCPSDGNNPPMVDAGPNVSIGSFAEVLQLSGQVSDDGLPSGSMLRTRWSRYEGPGTVSFSNPSSPTSTVTFSTNGLYVLKLDADDTAVQRNALVEVRVGIPCSVTDPAGLVAAWPGNGSALDVVGGRFGILGNGASFSAGKVASAFRLDGNDYVQVPAQASYDVGTSASGFSVEFWIKPDSLTVGGVLGWAGGVRAERLSSGGLLRFHVASSGTNYAQATLWPSIASLAWTHVALTYDRMSSQARIYANAVLVAATTVGTNLLTTASDFYLGQAPGSTGFYPGLLDEIALYARPLSQSDIQAIFNTGSAGKCITPSSGPFVVASAANPNQIASVESAPMDLTSGVTATGPMLASSVHGSELTLSWPAAHTGWRLQSQTNALRAGLTTNWVDVVGSGATNRIVIPIDPASGSVFFRLLLP